MSLKFKDKIDFATFDNILEGDANVALSYHVWLPTLKKKLLGFWILFLIFKRNMKFLDVEP